MNPFIVCFIVMFAHVICCRRVFGVARSLHRVVACRGESWKAFVTGGKAASMDLSIFDKI